MHLDQHNDWVRDVAWAPTFNFHRDKIASCSQVKLSIEYCILNIIHHMSCDFPIKDGHVYIFTRDQRSSTNWQCTQIDAQLHDAWSVSWSLTGDILAVAAADKVSLWKMGLDGKYQCLTTPQASSTSTGSASANSTMDSATGETNNIPLMAS
jgi:protein transport protein SEC13